MGTITVPSPFDSVDDTLGWNVLPNMNVRHTKLDLWDVNISTNSNGMRGAEFNVTELSKSTLKIGVFGASQTFGESVNDDEEFAALLNKQLTDASVFTFGVRGYGTDQMLLKYKQTLNHYHFDIVILAFAFHHIPRNINSFTFHAKPYFEYSENSLKLNGVPIPKPFDLYDMPIPDINNNSLNKSIVMRYLLSIYRQLESAKIYNESSYAWNVTSKIIEKFSIISKEQGTRFILVNIEEKFEDLEPSLKQLTAQLNIEFYNLGPILRNALDKHQNIYTNDNHHWTKEGHSYVAENIIEYLKCNRSNKVC